MVNYLKKDIYELIRKDISIYDFIKDSPLEGFSYWDLQKPEIEPSHTCFWTNLGFKPDAIPQVSNLKYEINSVDDFKLALNDFLILVNKLDHSSDELVSYIHKNGSTILIRSRELSVESKKLNTLSEIGIHYDITVFKNTDSALIKSFEKTKKEELGQKEEEKIFQNIFHHINKGALVLLPIKRGEDFIILDANSAAEKIWLAQKNDFVNKTLLQKFSHIENTSFFEALKQVYISGKGLEEPLLFQDKTDKKWKEYHIFNLPTGEVVSVFDDVTKRITAENELKEQLKVSKAAQEKAIESENKYKTILDNINTGVIIYNTDKSISYCNKIACCALGVKDKDIINKTHIDLGWIFFHNEETPFTEDDCFIKRVLKSGEEVINQNVGIMHPGMNEKSWMMVSAKPLFDKSNKIDQVLVSFTDVSKSKHEEISLIEAKKNAEERDMLKSAFLANMSHEIRTPMNGILGFTELLKEPDLMPEEQKEYIDIIEKSGQRLLSIINDIIDISKIESGLMQLASTETNVNEIMDFTYNFFRPEIENKGLQFIYNHKLLQNEAIIKTDSEKLYAIMGNLVKNAIKYSKEGSIEFGCVSKGKYLEFFVKDTGIGIPEERQKHIFNRFIRVHSSKNHAVQGAGLGLSITKAYVEMMGGKIWFESKENKGSVFYFTLPANEKQGKKSTISAKDKPKEGNNLKVLIAEEDETGYLLISLALRKINAEIVRAKTGREAVEICIEKQDIDLVMMDIKMPELNGLDATREIRKFNKNIIIIAQTAYGLLGDREKALDAGCNDYMTKPIRQSELLALLKNYFSF
ncbi:MAG: ATP-binding protein [Bacteroidales bacterium]|nr:ATP-binding protein [Bacteroidales bacterium]